LHAVHACGYKRDPGAWEHWELQETLNAVAAFARAQDFDVIHSHSYHYALAFCALTDTPVVHTYHINPPGPVRRAFAALGEAAHLVAVSEYHRRKHRDLPDVTVIPNGIDVDRFALSPHAGDALLALGHLIPRKGVVEAIEVARAAGRRLILAGRGEGEYFERDVAPLVDGEQVVHVGPVGVVQRDRLLADAAALLFMSPNAEPFGLVMLEAMACGTPVAALERCAVAEIVMPGVTGHHAPDPAGVARLLPEVLALDRARVRAEVTRRFGHERMADGHEALYRRLTAR
jgi:glycosyltransferase involved in cell wall biosynthesis